MNEINDKDKIIKEYLDHQMDNNVFINQILSPDNIQIHRSLNNSNNDNIQNANDNDLDEFKECVKYWMSLDNEIKDLNKKIKLLDVERKRRKLIVQALTPKITQYMQMNDIEELNSKDGNLKYREVYVKEPPLPNKILKTKLYDNFGTNEQNIELLNKLFLNRNKIKKESLKRLTY